MTINSKNVCIMIADHITKFNKLNENSLKNAWKNRIKLFSSLDPNWTNLKFLN